MMTNPHSNQDEQEAKTARIVLDIMQTQSTYNPDDWPSEDHFIAARIAKHIHEYFDLKSAPQPANTLPTPPTDHDPVNTWMLAGGWKHSDVMGFWYKSIDPSHPFKTVSDCIAAEMYRMSEVRVAEAKQETKNLEAATYRDLSDFAEALDDEAAPEWAVNQARQLASNHLPKGHPDYWKHHCVTCGLWLGGEPEQEGYCQCE